MNGKKYGTCIVRGSIGSFKSDVYPEREILTHLLTDLFQIGGHHHAHQLFERCVRFPPQLFARALSVTPQIAYLRGTKEFLVHSHNNSSFCVFTDLAQAFAAPTDRHTKFFCRRLDELTDGMRLAGRYYVIFRRFLLKHEMHRAHRVSRKTPVAFCFEIAKRETFLEPELDMREGERGLPRDEVFPAPRTLVIEKDTRADK